MKEVIVLGGPNGAGKTTASRTLLPRDLRIREFVNADEIARGLSPYNPEGTSIAAARVMIERIQELTGAGKSFALETTCAGRGYVRLLESCRAAGYRQTLVFLWLPSPQAALKRVAKRVRDGGHNIPKEVVIRRYWKGLYNMRHVYMPMMDVSLIYDNSDTGRLLIAKQTPELGMTIYEPAQWKRIEDARR